MDQSNPLLTQAARAWLASIQNVPQEQVPAQAIQAAQTGALSFGDAIAIKQMADRVRQARGAQAPQPGNVMLDLIKQINSGQPAPMDQGLASLPAPAMQQAQFAGGVAGGMAQPQMPPEMMQQPPMGMAGGGVVAFQEGGPTGYGIQKAMLVRKLNAAKQAGASPEEIAAIEREIEALPSPIDPTRALNALRQSLGMGQYAKGRQPTIPREAPIAPPEAPPQDQAGVAALADQRVPPPPPPPPPAPERRVSPLQEEMAAAAAIFGKAEEPRSTKSYIEELEALQKERGIGGASQEARAIFDQERAEMQEQARKDRHLLLSQAGFKMMAAAAKGARFGAAVGEAGDLYATGMRDLNKSLAQSKREMSREQLRLKQSDEALAAGNINAAMRLNQDAVESANKAKGERERAVLQMYMGRLNRDVNLAQLDATERNSMITLAVRASEAAASAMERTMYSPGFVKLKPEEQRAMLTQVGDKAYNDFITQVYQLTGKTPPQGATQSTGQTLKYNPQTGKVE